jgi:diguanylate cyclase (GGDEF)-like protein
MRSSVGFKLGVWLALLGILATGLMGLYAYTQSRQMLIDSSQDKLLTATRVLALRFSHSIAAVVSDVKFLASLPAARSLGAGRSDIRQASEYRKHLENVMSSMMRTHPEYFQVRLIGLADYGREIVRVDRTGDDIEVIRGNDLQEKAHFPYFFKTIRLAPGEFYISSISLNHEQGSHAGMGQPTLRIATPVQTEDGSIFGVMVVNVDLNSLFVFIRKDIPRDIELVLTNQEGDYLVHPVAARTFGFDKGVRYRIQEDIPRLRPLLERDDREQAVLNTGDIARPDRGVAAAFVKVPFVSHAEQSFVLLGLLTPLDTVLQETRTLGMNMIQITLLFSLVAIGIALALALYLSRPLNAMARAVQRFAAGEPMAGLPVNRNDEIGYLASTFQSMAARLTARVDELKNHQQILGNLAYYDHLTGLPNRLLFLDRLKQTLIKAERNRTRFAVMFVDLDKFKEINDTFGHAVGDEVLKVAAARMQDCIRHADTLARLAGDEFTILLEDLNTPSDAARIAQKIIDYFADPFMVGTREMTMSCSLGIGIYPQDGTTVDDLLFSADTAMYRAKEQGRNAFRFYSEKV